MANSNYFFQSDLESILGDIPQYFYGFRRTDTGQLYFGKVNQLKTGDVIEINRSGYLEENFTDFEPGVDFFEGRDANHEIVFDNLTYEQYRWDTRSIYYYINADGNLIARVNQAYQYPSGV